MSPKCWGLRHVSPIRKAVPSTVDKVKNLRPISRASDLSSPSTFAVDGTM